MGRKSRRVVALTVVLLGLITLLTSSASAHNVAWTRQFGSSGFDSVRAIAADSAGNLYVAGFTAQLLPGGPDAFVRKYDSAGNLVWSRQFGTSADDLAFAVAVDRSGNVYVGGDTGGVLPGQTSAGDVDAFVRRYDSTGNEVWTRQFGTSGFDVVRGIAVDGTGNIYVGGHVGGALPGNVHAGNDDAFLRKYDSAGNEVWTRQFGTSGDDVIHAVAVDGAGKIYVGGFTDLSLPSQSSAGAIDAFVRKYDRAGNELWTRQFGSSLNDEVNGIAVDALGRIYVLGSTGGTLPGQSSGGDFDAFVRKYGSGGNLIWTRQFGTSGMDEGLGVDADGAGNGYVAGLIAGTASGGSLTSGDVFVRKYDSAGKEMWTRQLGTPAVDLAFGVKVDTGGNVFTGGRTDGSLPGQTAAGGADAFVAKLPMARVWIGLKSRTDVGLRLDLLVEEFIDSAKVSEALAKTVPSGGSDFRSAILQLIPLDVAGGAAPSGAGLKLKVSARRTCFGGGRSSGRARLWFNGPPTDSGPGRDAGSRFDAAVAGDTREFFLGEGFTLSTAVGTSRHFLDVSVDSAAACPGRPFTPWGTWGVTLP